MKNYKMKLLCGVCGIAVMADLIPVYAADTYTITYRAGDVGTFDVKGWEQTLNQAGYDSSTTEITENYIKIKAAKGAEVPDFSQTQWEANTDIAQEQTYFILTESKWGPAEGAIVTRNQDYVVDYGVLVNPVKYEIAFVDAATGAAIAPPVISYGNEGEQISCTPIAVQDYETAAQPATLTLKKDEENQILFSYNSTLVPETEERTVQQTETVTRTEPGQTVVLPNNNSNTANTTTITDTNVPNGNTPNAGGTPENDAGENPDQNDADTEELTDIGENEVPRIDQVPEEKTQNETKQPDDETVTIQDTKVPQAQEVHKDSTQILPIIGSTAAALAGVGGIVFTRRRKSRLRKE